MTTTIFNETSTCVYVNKKEEEEETKNTKQLEKRTETEVF